MYAGRTYGGPIPHDLAVISKPRCSLLSLLHMVLTRKNYSNELVKILLHNRALTTTHDLNLRSDVPVEDLCPRVRIFPRPPFRKGKGKGKGKGPLFGFLGKGQGNIAANGAAVPPPAVADGLFGEGQGNGKGAAVNGGAVPTPADGLFGEGQAGKGATVVGATVEATRAPAVDVPALTRRRRARREYKYRAVLDLNPLPVLLTTVLLGPSRYGAALEILQRPDLSENHLNYYLPLWVAGSGEDGACAGASGDWSGEASNGRPTVGRSREWFQQNSEMEDVRKENFVHHAFSPPYRKAREMVLARQLHRVEDTWPDFVCGYHV